MDRDEFLYMAEAEGRDDLVHTRTARINAVIKDIRSAREQGVDPNEVWQGICASHGIDPDSLTASEQDRMNCGI